MHVFMMQSWSNTPCMLQVDIHASALPPGHSSVFSPMPFKIQADNINNTVPPTMSWMAVSKGPAKEEGSKLHILKSSGAAEPEMPASITEKSIPQKMAKPNAKAPWAVEVPPAE